MDKQKIPTGLKSAGRILFRIVFVVFFVASFWSIVDLDGLNSPRRWETVIRIFTALSQPNFSDPETVQVVLSKILETFEMGFLATTIGAVLATPFTYLTARSSSPWGKGFRILLEPVLLIVRSIHPLVGVIFAVTITGLGPAAGVLAIAIYSTAVLIGIFSEYAQEYRSLRWAELIKVYFPGLAFKHMPVNLLIATVIGFTGGGGIGFILQQKINLLNYRDASVVLIACIVMIGSIDLASRAVWRKILKKAELNQTI